MVNDRIAVLQLKISKQVNITFINVYATLMGRAAEESNAVYNTHPQTIQRFLHELLFI